MGSWEGGIYGIPWDGSICNPLPSMDLILDPQSTRGGGGGEGGGQARLEGRLFGLAAAGLTIEPSY